MTLETFIEHYGYLAVLLGMLIEGETVLLLAGVASESGHLNIGVTVATAMCGAFAIDQIYFFLGRRHSRDVMVWLPRLSSRIAKVQELLKRYHDHVAFFFRFLYGLRSLVPFVMGMGTMPYRRFVVLNAAGVVTWVLLYAMAGYVLGSALEVLLGDIRRFERVTFLAICLVGVVAAGVWMVRSRRRAAGRRRT